MNTYPDAFLNLCTALDLKLTSLRREVLYILWRANKPIKAYEVLEQLLQTKPNAKPPSVYRALMFFAERGVVHKIESIQSYTLCHEPEKHLLSEVLMVCDNCHHVTEVHDHSLQSLVFELANQHQFKLRQDCIELKGLCSSCLRASHPNFV